MDNKKIRAILLASGSSTRFGTENKLLSKIKDKTLFEITLENVITSNCFHEIVVVTKYNEIIECTNNIDKKVILIENHNSEKGISESIKLGASIDSDIDGYMFFQCDQPFLSINTIKKLVQAFNNNIVVPNYNGTYGSPKIFPLSLKDSLLKLSGDNGGKEILLQIKTSIIEVEIENSFENIDIDVKEDLNVKN